MPSMSSYSLYRCAVLSTSSGSLAGILDRDSPVQILPLGVKMGSQRLADGIEISNQDYCRWRETHRDEEVSTTPPSVELMRNTFQHLIREGYHQVIATTLSHKMSDTAQVLRSLTAEFPQLEIHIVDTGMCCMPEGFLALEALRLLREGRSPQETVAYLERLKGNCHIIFGLSSLKTLSLSSTVARLGASFSDWLGLRTVLSFAQDNLSRVETVSDDEAMFDSVIKNTKKLLEGKNPSDFVLAGMYSGDPDIYRQFANRFHQRTGLRLGEGMPVSPAVAVHVGTGGIGVGLVEKLDD